MYIFLGPGLGVVIPKMLYIILTGHLCILRIHAGFRSSKRAAAEYVRPTTNWPLINIVIYDNHLPKTLIKILTFFDLGFSPFISN